MAAPQSVRIGISRTGCEGPCPVYSVVVTGDGAVEYNGLRNVDIKGRHVYQIPPADVQTLIGFVAKNDLWSIRRDFIAPVSDIAETTVTLTIGPETHTFRSRWGHLVGMPAEVTEFEVLVNRVSRADQWFNLSTFSLQKLLEEGFTVRSSEGARLLASSIGNDRGKDEAAMLRLLELGAPIEGGGTEYYLEDKLIKWTTFDWALQHRRASLVAPMIAQGALLSNGQRDPEKLGRAWRSAIVGGRLSAAKAVWDATPEMRPPLKFLDEDKDVYGKVADRRSSPVLLLLENDSRLNGVWEGLAIAQWLTGLGLDINARAANGKNLLQIAAEAGDVAMVRWLLANGVDPSAPGEYDHVALFNTEVEKIALILLDAGCRHDRLDGRRFDYREYAQSRGWKEVPNWLEAHRKNRH